MSAFPPINPKIPGITNPNTISNQNNVVASPAVGGTGAINDPSTTLPFGYDSTSNNFYLELSNRTSGNVCTIEFYVDSSVHFVNPVFPNYGSGIGNYQIVGTNTNSFGTSGQVLTSQGANVLPVWTTPSIGSGTVTSVTFTGDGTVLSATPSTSVTTSGTVTAALKTQIAKTFLSGPTSGTAAVPTFRAIAVADVPTLNQDTTGNAATATVATTVTTSPGRLLNLQIFKTSRTYTKTTGTNTIYAIAVGGGGGGGPTGTAGGTAGGTGGSTSLGSSLIAVGGAGAALGNTNPTGAAGGQASACTGTLAFTGDAGLNGTAINSSFIPGGTGGGSIYGGAGVGGNSAAAGNAGATNSGGGGGGAGGNGSTQNGTGGGGGAASAYYYGTTSGVGTTVTIGAGGTAGVAGTSGFNGGSGGSGILLIYEYS